MPNPLIELNNVSKTYSTAAGDFVALKEVNLVVETGEFLGIVGKSGAGKSTLLNMINGVDQLTSGEVIVHSDGKSTSIHEMSEDARALWRGKKMGVVYQSFQLLPMLTLIENIEDVIGGDGIEAACRFIGDEDGRVIGKCARDGNALLLPA